MLGLKGKVAIISSTAAAVLAFVAYMLFSWAPWSCATFMFTVFVALPMGWSGLPMLLFFWLAPHTTGGAVVSVWAQTMLNRMLQGHAHEGPHYLALLQAPRFSTRRRMFHASCSGLVSSASGYQCTKLGGHRCPGSIGSDGPMGEYAGSVMLRAMAAVEDVQLVVVDRKKLDDMVCTFQPAGSASASQRESWAQDVVPRLQRQQAGDPLPNERPTRVIVWNGLQGASDHFDATSLLECGTAV